MDGRKKKRKKKKRRGKSIIKKCQMCAYLNLTKKDTGQF